MNRCPRCVSGDCIKCAIYDEARESLYEHLLNEREIMLIPEGTSLEERMIIVRARRRLACQSWGDLDYEELQKLLGALPQMPT